MPVCPVVMVACLPNESADSNKLDTTICQTCITVILTANYHHFTLHQSVTHFRFQWWQLLRLLSSEMWRHIVLQKLTEVSDENCLSLHCILTCVRLPVHCLSFYTFQYTVQGIKNYVLKFLIIFTNHKVI